MVYTLKTIAYVINYKFVENLYWVCKHRVKKASLLSSLLCGASHLLDSSKLLIKNALRLLTENLLSDTWFYMVWWHLTMAQFTNV